MAQYTPVLAAEYNSIQLDVTKVLGDRFADTSARAWGYGAATSSTSVVVGQRITASEWGLLAQDVRSAYWYQTGGDYGVPANVVQGNKVFWANVVAYQNAASTIVSNAGSTTVGASNRTTQAYTDRTLAVWTTYGIYRLSRKYQFTDAAQMSRGWGSPCRCGRIRPHRCGYLRASPLPTDRLVTTHQSAFRSSVSTADIRSGQSPLVSPSSPRCPIRSRRTDATSSSCATSTARALAMTIASNAEWTPIW